tara:strand:+ start:2420 stop:3184 length:765 start_codon:yes stop_codon:yes gene_type:complete
MSFVDTGDTQYKTGQKIEFYHIPTDQAVDFKAYITDFSDDYSSNWESEEVYGRMDPIQTFKNTSREITISFDIVAGSLAEAKSNLEKFSKLIGFLYPNYDMQHKSLAQGKVSVGANTISAAPLMRVKFMNLISSANNPTGTAKESGLVCSCKGFSFKPNLDTGFAFDPDANGFLYPKFYNVSMGLTVLHSHPLGFNQEGKTNIANFPYGVLGGPVPKPKTNPNEGQDSTRQNPDDVQQSSAQQSILSGPQSRTS